MTKESSLYAAEPIETLIVTVRGQKVILDSDLARVYGVPTKRLNEQVRRNGDRFPSDFVFQLTLEEVSHLRSQIATSSLQTVAVEYDNGMRSQIASASAAASLNDARNRSQIATGSQKHRDPRFLPYAFTEHGAIMAANVLNSSQAVRMSVFIVRAFVKMREQLLGRAELEARLSQIENVLLSHDKGIRELYATIRPLLLPPPENSPKEVAGFRVKERRTRYGARLRANPKSAIADRKST